MQYQAREAMQSILEFETCLRTCTGLGPKTSPGPNNTYLHSRRTRREVNVIMITISPGYLTSASWVQLNVVSGFDRKPRFYGTKTDWESLVADPKVQAQPWVRSVNIRDAVRPRFLETLSVLLLSGCVSEGVNGMRSRNTPWKVLGGIGIERIQFGKENSQHQWLCEE